MNLDAQLLEILACPACKAPLRVDDDASELVCTNAECGLAYPVRDDIPVLLVDEARKPGEDGEDGEDGEPSADASGAEASATASATPSEDSGDEPVEPATPAAETGPEGSPDRDA